MITRSERLGYESLVDSRWVDAKDLNQAQLYPMLSVYNPMLVPRRVDASVRRSSVLASFERFELLLSPGIGI